MPIIKSAKKQVSSSARRRTMNLARRKANRETVKAALATPSMDNLKAAFKAVDKSAKQGIIHKNKASRIKSRLARTAAKSA